MNIFGALKSLNPRYRRRRREKRRWISADGDGRLRLDYPLERSDIVFDVGGYRGQWASDIFGMYGCTVHVFEPVPEFAAYIRRRFARNPNIHVHEFGLAESTLRVPISVDADSSSVFHHGDQSTDIQLRDVSEVIRELGIPEIHLIKINIEGGEYPLIERLRNAGLLPRIRDIQVQFHDFIPDAQQKRKNAYAQLSVTHHPTYQFDFIWENWTRNS